MYLGMMRDVSKFLKIFLEFDTEFVFNEDVYSLYIQAKFPWNINEARGQLISEK